MSDETTKATKEIAMTLPEMYAKHLAEVATLTRERDEARDWVRKMHSDAQVLTCVYCGHAYPPGTPASGSPALTEHIAQCEKHPLHAALADAARLRQERAHAEKRADENFVSYERVKGLYSNERARATALQEQLTRSEAACGAMREALAARACVWHDGVFGCSMCRMPCVYGVVEHLTRCPLATDSGLALLAALDLANTELTEYAEACGGCDHLDVRGCDDCAGARAALAAIAKVRS